MNYRRSRNCFGKWKRSVHERACSLRATAEEGGAGEHCGGENAGAEASLREQIDTVSTAQRLLKEHSASCKVARPTVGRPEKITVGCYAHKDPKHGSLDCIVAFLGDANWSRSKVGRILEAANKLDPFVVSKVAPVGRVGQCGEFICGGASGGRMREAGAANDSQTKIGSSGVIIKREGKSMSIYTEGNEQLRDDTGSNSNIGTFTTDKTRITFAHGARIDRPDLLHIAMAIEPLTRPRFEQQTDAPASILEEPHRPRIILQPGTNSLFRAIGGSVKYANPVGSIEGGFFLPTPGVMFGYKELIDIAGHLAQKAYSAKA